jgi:hypothetical protein
MIGTSEIMVTLGVIFYLIFYLIIPLLLLIMIYKFRKIDNIQIEQSKKIESIQRELNRIQGELK